VLAWFVKKLLFVLAFAFVVATAIELGSDWDSASVHVNLLWLAVAVPFAFLAALAQSVAFHRLVEAWTGQTVSRLRTRELFFASQLARYTPGRLGLLAIRIARAPELGLPKEHLAAATMGEVLAWLVTGVAALALSLATTEIAAFEAYLDISKAGYAAAFLLLLSAILLCAVPRKTWTIVLGPKISTFIFVTSGRTDRPLLPFSALALIFVHWLLWVLHGSFLGLSVGMPERLFTFSGTALLFSIFAGFFAFFAPAGVGVREAVLAYCLAPWVGAANATLVGVMARGASLLAEVVLFLLARLRLRQNLKAEKLSSPELV
jgi:glycosyltransferase 2 family protein